MMENVSSLVVLNHYDVIKWKHFPRYCPFVRGNNRSAVDSPHTKGQQRRPLMFLCCQFEQTVEQTLD